MAYCTEIQLIVLLNNIGRLDKDDSQLVQKQNEYCFLDQIPAVT